jgi:hypothetical protein
MTDDHKAQCHINCAMALLWPFGCVIDNHVHYFLPSAVYKRFDQGLGPTIARIRITSNMNTILHMPTVPDLKCPTAPLP